MHYSRIVAYFYIVYPFANHTEQTDLRELKRAAMIRRTDKLMGWLARPEYALYEDSNSTDHLLKLTDLVIKEWRPFLRSFKKVKNTILGYTDAEPGQKIDDTANYHLGISLLLETLNRYKQHIDYDI